jgi:hypothetical protein
MEKTPHKGDFQSLHLNILQLSLAKEIADVNSVKTEGCDSFATSFLDQICWRLNEPAWKKPA